MLLLITCASYNMARISSSGLVPVAQTHTFNNVDPHFNQLFVTAKYFTDATGGTQITPSSGTISVTGRPNGAGGYQPLSESPLDCTDPSDVSSTNVPLDSVICAPSSIADASHYQITITAKQE